MNKINKVDLSVKQHKSGLYYEYLDSDIFCPYNKGGVTIDIYKSQKDNTGVIVNLEMVGDYDDFEFEGEPDGEATYVPYGSQGVMYESGEGGLSAVSTSADVADYQFLDYEEADPDTPITKEQALEILGCSEEDLADLMRKVESLAIQYTEALLEEYYEDPLNGPDKPEDEPDWRDLDGD